jgi:cell division protein FtsX
MKTKLITLANSIRSLNPIGAAALFIVAWLAGMIGSFAALAIAAALFAGLYVARLSVVPEVVASAPAAIESPQIPVLPVAMADSLAGMIVKKIELSQPVAVKAPKTVAA